MNKLITLISLLALFSNQAAWSVGKIQNEDVKSVTDLTNAGSDQTHLVNDSKIYDTTNGQQLSLSIANGSLGGAGAGVQLISNASFENGTSQTGWTTTTATAANETSTIYSGKQSVKLTFSSSTGDIAQSVTPTVNTLSVNMEASCKVNTTMSTIQVCALSGGTEVQCVNAPASGTWSYVSASMVGPSNGTTVGVRVKTSASATGTAYADDCYVGPARNLSQVSQAVIAGSLVFPETASCVWPITQASYAADFSAVSACPSATVTGSITSPSKTPQMQYVNAPPGDYEVSFDVVVFQASNANAKCRLVDDLGNTMDEHGLATINTVNVPLHLGGKQTYTTAATRTWKVQCQSTSGAVSLEAQTTDFGQLSGLVKYFPSSSQTAVKADVTPANWSGYLTAGTDWTTTSSTYADPTGGASIVLNQIGTPRNITCTAAGSSLPGVSCTLPRTGNYYVCSNVSLLPAASSTSSVRLVDGSNTVINPGTSVGFGSSTYGSWHGCGTYNATSVTSNITFKVQLATGSSTAHITNGQASGSAAVMFSIVEGDAPMPAPYLTGSVVSTSSGVERVERVTVPTGCSAGTCTSTSTPGISSVTFSSTGVYNVNFVAGNYSATPVCVAASYDTGLNSAIPQSGASTSLQVVKTFSSGGSASNLGFNMICTGPK